MIFLKLEISSHSIKKKKMRPFTIRNEVKGKVERMVMF